MPKLKLAKMGVKVRKFIVTTLALIVSLTLPALSTASEAKSAFQSLSECERKFVQDFLKVEGYYKSSVDGVWGSGTEKAIVKYAHGRSVTNIIKSLGKCLPAGANLSNAYFLMPEVSDNLRGGFYIYANKDFTTAYPGCLSEILESDKEYDSWNHLLNTFEACMAGKGQVRVDHKLYNKILDEIGELRSQTIKMTQ